MQSFLYTPVSDIRDEGPAYDDENPDEAILLAPAPPNTEEPPHVPRVEDEVDEVVGEPQLKTAATPEPAIC